MREAELREATRIVRSGLTAVKAGDPLHAGPAFVSTFYTPGNPGDAPYTYGRSHNPTWTELERAIGWLEGEGAGARIFGSGLAAIAAVFGAVLRPGDTVVLPGNAYFAARQLLEEMFAPMGVRLRKAATERLGSAEALAGAKLVWLETPSNPSLEITDVRAIAEAAHRAGALVAVDNTTASPLAQKPLTLGADFSVCSDSKAMCGHSDLLLGHVATLDSELLAKIDRERTLRGAIAGPMEAWLALRSLATLPLRLERSSANARAIAEFLQGRNEVAEVLYPGLQTHVGHEIAARQMSYFGPVLGFTLNGREAAERFLGASKLVTEATSFGGVTTTAERRARWGHDEIAPGFIRMSAGCEDAQDLIRDIGRALDAIR